ncbi:uncharacterized protein LOC107039055 [Diachasma alloeum]|uniref:uncharacterized protein LOC107039055 n=1 Tax=Diachasma alloeum TaxID=454923 RepID=UPI000738177C|nr:uncharacterized protein LOC107039055 [Diachasma alloeum]
MRSLTTKPQRCTRGGTQNANESLLSIIWRNCPKHVYMSLKKLRIFVTKGVGRFNMGCRHCQQLRAGIKNKKSSSYSKKIFRKQDDRRVSRSANQQIITSKKFTRKMEQSSEPLKCRNSRGKEDHHTKLEDSKMETGKLEIWQDFI